MKLGEQVWETARFSRYKATFGRGQGCPAALGGPGKPREAQQGWATSNIGRRWGDPWFAGHRAAPARVEGTRRLLAQVVVLGRRAVSERI